MTRSLIILTMAALPALADDSVRISGAGYTLEGVLTPAADFVHTPPAAPEPCIGDANRDGRITSIDFMLFLNAFATQTAGGDVAPPYGRFDVFDFLAFQQAYANGC